MKAMPVEWHERNLKGMLNTRKSLDQDLVDLAKMMQNLAREIDFLRLQISEAKARGKAAFDSERFLKTNIRKCI